LPPGAERWSSTVGKPCPTARRIQQIRNVIIPRVQAVLRGEQEDDMANFTDADRAKLLRAADQILGAVGAGQTTYAGTVESTLAGVQGLVNLVKDRTSTLAASIADTRSAVLAAIAAMPTDHLDDAELAALAERIGTALAQSGVDVGPDALLDALHARLAA
jgi:hypothetical protein